MSDNSNKPLDNSPDSQVSEFEIAEITEKATVKERSPFEVVLTRFRRHKLAMIASVIMILFFLISIFAPVIAPFPRDQLDLTRRFAPIGGVDEKTGKTFILGTDDLGRDYFTRIVYAARVSLTIAFISVVISEVAGVIIGAVAGYFSGTVDNVLMRFTEFINTIPTIPLLLIISAMLLQNENLLPIPEPILKFFSTIMLVSIRDARSAVLLILILSGLGWLTSALLMRGSLLSIREMTYIEASRSLGASHLQIIFKHMIPNALAPIIVSATFALAGYIVAEASLSFLGFGIQDPVPTWGNMLSATQRFMLDKPYLPLIPGIPIFLCSLAFNYVGDGLRDALDPRLKL